MNPETFVEIRVALDAVELGIVLLTIIALGFALSSLYFLYLLYRSAPKDEDREAKSDE